MANITAGSFPSNGIDRGALGFLPSDTSMFAAMRVFPVRTTATTTGSYLTFTRADQQRINTTGYLSPMGTADRIEVGATSSSFNCQAKAARYLVTHVEAKNAAGTGMYDPRMVHTTTVVSQVLRIVEDHWAGAYFTTGVWGTDQSAPSTKWDSADGGDPIGNIGTAINTIAGQLDGGARGLVGVCGGSVWRTLQRHPAFKDFSGVINAQGTQLATIEKVAMACGLDNIIVSDAVKNTALDGVTQSNSAIVGDGFLVVKVAEAFNPMDPTAGATFVSSPLTPRSYRTEELQTGAFWVEAMVEYAFAVPFAGGGVFIQDVLT